MMSPSAITGALDLRRKACIAFASPIDHGSNVVIIAYLVAALKLVLRKSLRLLRFDRSKSMTKALIYRKPSSITSKSRH